jgi:hypothetical protein
VIKPSYIPKINFLRRERSILVPSIVFDEMSRKYFVTHFQNQAYYLSRRYDSGAISGKGETKINCHGDMKFNIDSIFVRFERSALTNVAMGALTRALILSSLRWQNKFELCAMVNT